MRNLAALCTVIALSACASAGREAEQPSAGTVKADPVFYYDRNGDGSIDLELHEVGCCDRTWLLVDTDFNGRYDLKVHWGYAFTKTPVDIVVADGVVISSDESLIPSW